MSDSLEPQETAPELPTCPTCSSTSAQQLGITCTYGDPVEEHKYMCSNSHHFSVKRYSKMFDYTPDPVSLGMLVDHCWEIPPGESVPNPILNSDAAAIPRKARRCHLPECKRMHAVQLYVTGKMLSLEEPLANENYLQLGYMDYHTLCCVCNSLKPAHLRFYNHNTMRKEALFIDYHTECVKRCHKHDRKSGGGARASIVPASTESSSSSSPASQGFTCNGNKRLYSQLSTL